MRRLVESGIMKAFTVDGVLHCSYRTIKVGENHIMQREASVERESFLFS